MCAGSGHADRDHGRPGVAARHGILIRTPKALELAHAVTHVAFDKTGTLTEGRPTLVALRAAAGQSRDEVLRLGGRTASRPANTRWRAR